MHGLYRGGIAAGDPGIARRTDVGAWPVLSRLLCRTLRAPDPAARHWSPSAERP